MHIWPFSELKQTQKSSLSRLDCLATKKSHSFIISDAQGELHLISPFSLRNRRESTIKFRTIGVNKPETRHYPGSITWSALELGRNSAKVPEDALYKWQRRIEQSFRLQVGWNQKWRTFKLNEFFSFNIIYLNLIHLFQLSWNYFKE